MNPFADALRFLARSVILSSRSLPAMAVIIPQCECEFARFQKQPYLLCEANFAVNHRKLRHVTAEVLRTWIVMAEISAVNKSLKPQQKWRLQ